MRKIIDLAEVIEKNAQEIIELSGGYPDPPDSPLPDPPDPEPPPVVWDITKRIGMVYIGNKDVPIRYAVAMGDTGGLKPIPKILKVEMFRDYPPLGKDPNIAYDRYKFPEGELIYVYCPTKSNYWKSKGRWSTPGPGGMNMWEAVAGQGALRSKVLLPKSPTDTPQQHKKTRLTYDHRGLVVRHKLYLPVFLCHTRIPEIVPPDQRGALEFWR